LSGQVASNAAANPTLVSVNFTTTGIYNKLPQSVKSLIVEKLLYVPCRYTNGSLLTDDNLGQWRNVGKLWLPYEQEVFGMNMNETGNKSTVINCSIAFVQYPIFANNMSKIKIFETDGNRTTWWLASVRSNFSMGSSTVGTNGVCYPMDTSQLYGVPLCFRIT
jgi:hypothetical protein